ncbi:hypothetical protein OPQ81_005147 [Rhizoctonia solani]|nr:hypothetical protein OPQ81_005147 [Rhizoctonia solani]
MARRSIVGSIKNRRAIGKSQGAQSITPLFVLSTIFSAMFLGSAKSLPQHIPTTPPKRKSELAEAIHDLWHSIFDWTFFMLIITPKPTIRTINEHRKHQSMTTDNNGFSSRFARLFAAVGGLFTRAIKGAFAILRSPFTSKSESQSPILPQYIPSSSQVDVSLDATTTPPSTVPSAPSMSDNAIQAPARAVTPTNRPPNSDSTPSPKASPTTARFLATLTDLEAQMNNHQFYDLERELEAMDNQMAQMFDFPWMPHKTPPESPIPVVLPQAPPPARRDGKTIQILPMICEVSENSPDLAHTPPYDPRRWSIVTFQPLWGPRAQVGTAY